MYERTERRGAMFERLREDVDAVAAVSGMQDVFKLRAADIYRVSQIDAACAVPKAASPEAERDEPRAPRSAPSGSASSPHV